MTMNRKTFTAGIKSLAAAVNSNLPAELAFYAVQHSCQPFMVGGAEMCLIVAFCANIRRVTVEQRLWPVIGADKMLKVLVLDNNLFKPFLHGSERCSNVAYTLLRCGEGVPVTAKAGLDKVKAAGSPLYVS